MVPAFSNFTYIPSQLREEAVAMIHSRTDLSHSSLTTYQCVVSNGGGRGLGRLYVVLSSVNTSKPFQQGSLARSRSPRQLSSAPGKVQNLRANSDESSIYLMWSKPTEGGSIESYKIKWGKTHPGPDEMTLKKSDLSALIKGLDSTSKYIISVISVGFNGEEESAIIDYDTKSEGYKANLGIPLNVVSQTDKNVILLWDQPQRMAFDNFRVHKYEVEYRYNSHLGSPLSDLSLSDENRPSQVNHVNVTGDKTRVRLDNLISGMTYRCKVRSYYTMRSFPQSLQEEDASVNENMLMVSQWSMEHQFATKNIAPVEPPRNITIHALGITYTTTGTDSEIRASIQVSWQPPESPPRTVPLPITTYSIFYSADPQPNKMSLTSWMKLSFVGHNLNAVIPQLLPDTYYYLYMYAVNEVGLSPSSPIMVFKTTNSKGFGGGQVKIPVYSDLRNLIHDLIDTGRIVSFPLEHGRQPSAGELSSPMPPVDSAINKKPPPKTESLFDDKTIWYITGGVAVITLTLVAIVIVILIKCRSSANSSNHTNSNGYKVGNKHLVHGRQEEGLHYNGHSGKTDAAYRKNGSVVTSSGGCDTSGSPLLCEDTGNRYPTAGALHLPDMFYHSESVSSAILMQHNQRMIELERCKSNSDRTSSDEPDLTSVSQRHLFPTSAYHSPNSLNDAAVMVAPPNMNSVMCPPYVGVSSAMAMANAGRHGLASTALPGSPQRHTHMMFNGPVNPHYSLLSAPSMGPTGSPHMSFLAPNLNTASSGPGALLVNTSVGSPQVTTHHIPQLVSMPANVPRVNASELNSLHCSGAEWGQNNAANVNNGSTAPTGVNNTDEDAAAHRRKYEGKDNSTPTTQSTRGSVNRRSVGLNSVDRASVLSQSDHEIPKNFSTEELSQEMANLEGLMRDLKAITQKEFEC